MLQTRTATSSSPSAPSVDPLVSESIEVDDDTEAFMVLAMERGWGDGLPLIAPTEERVRAAMLQDGSEFRIGESRIRVSFQKK